MSAKDDTGAVKTPSPSLTPPPPASLEDAVARWLKPPTIYCERHVNKHPCAVKGCNSICVSVGGWTREECMGCNRAICPPCSVGKCLYGYDGYAGFCSEECATQDCNECPRTNTLITAMCQDCLRYICKECEDKRSCTNCGEAFCKDCCVVNCSTCKIYLCSSCVDQDANVNYCHVCNTGCYTCEMTETCQMCEAPICGACADKKNAPFVDTPCARVN